MTKNKQSGALLIMTILILFVVILFISAAIYSVVCLNRLQMNENIVIRENIAVNSLISQFDYLSLYGDDKANLRGNLNIILNEESASGKVTFDSLGELKYLICEAQVDDQKDKKQIKKTAFKPVPLFNS